MLPTSNRIWNVLIGLGTAGILSLALFARGNAEAPKPPAYLATATYKTSAKCGMCHKPVSTTWAKTKHAMVATTCNWEAPAGKAPAPEEAYRHTTGYNAATNTWAEKGVGCESCHGPGSAHMAATKETRKTTIIVPTDLTPSQQLSVCGRCHGQYTIDGKRFAANFVPSQDLFANEKFKLDTELKEGAKFQELNELAQSKHYAKNITCETCHAPHSDKAAAHQLKQPVNELCLSCHKDKEMAKHAPDAKEDATCATCHMPNGMHTFAKPH